jgi:hypothetical protein
LADDPHALSVAISKNCVPLVKTYPFTVIEEIVEGFVEGFLSTSLNTPRPNGTPLHSIE